MDGYHSVGFSCGCGWVWVGAGERRCLRRPEALNSPELELQILVSRLMRVLRTELRYLGRTASIFNLWDTFLEPSCSSPFWAFRSQQSITVPCGEDRRLAHSNPAHPPPSGHHGLSSRAPISPGPSRFVFVLAESFLLVTKDFRGRSHLCFVVTGPSGSSVWKAICKHMDACVDTYVNTWVHGCIDECMGGWLNEWMDD